MVITKKVWPVSWVSDDGKQMNSIWDMCPGDKYWVGEPVELTFDYPDDLAAKVRAAKILELQAKLAALQEVVE
jgi:hypothetical protein